MRTSRAVLRGGLAALVALTAACNAILGINDVTEEPAPGCDLTPDLALITATPSISLLSHLMTGGGVGLGFPLDDDTMRDVLVMALYDNMGGHGVVNAVGSYTLTTADAWLGTCAICIAVATDFDPTTKMFSQNYFAAQGTLQIDMLDATGIAGSLKGLKLRQVDLSGDSMSDVVDGCSVTIEDAEFTATWSTTTSLGAPHDPAAALSAGMGSLTPTYQDDGLKHEGQQP